MPTPSDEPQVLVLASGSPRRRELLARLGVPFIVVVSDADETVPPGTPPEAMVRLLAERKAEAVSRDVGTAGRREGGGTAGQLVLGSDTTVALDGEILGKPLDAADNLALLGRLRGRTHEVWTGLALIDTATGAARTGAVRSLITMRGATDDELRAYVATGEGLDKAGGYGVQGRAGAFVTSVEGCWNNVVGLPLCEVARLLGEAGMVVTSDGPACRLPDGSACLRIAKT